MARADIFRNKRQAKILSFLKILPIYRMRDGADELSKNAGIFDKASIILGDKHSVCLMPEGNHGHQRRLRSLIKGSFRIALSSQEKFGDKLNVKIVPVGLDYEHYQKIHQDLLINYGPPIDVKEYMDFYHENQPRAINILKEKLSEELKKVMIHINSEKYHDVYHELRSIYNDRMRNRLGILRKSHYYRFIADKEMIRILDENFALHPEEMKEFSASVIEYSEGVKKLDLRYWVFDRKGYSLLKIILRIAMLIIFSPVFLFGWLNNLIPYTIPKRMIRNVKDPQFHSSFKFVIAMITFLSYYIVMTLIISLVFHQSWLSWLYIPAGLFSGYLALNYSSWYKKTKASVRFKSFLRKSDPVILKLINLHKKITSRMNAMVEDYQKRYLPENKMKKDVRKGIL